jgi:UDP:flavonoid glycosyltransferase YjiC (YdhE family)
MLGAMGAGCPMVVVPLGADQLESALRAQRLGIARVVDPADATPETLRAAIAEVLESRNRRESCDRLQQEVAAMSGLHELPAELQRLVN